MCRTGSIKLLDRDLQFHNRHFRYGTDLMLILNEGPDREILIELFAPSSNAPLSLEKFRCGFFRLSPDVALPIDVNLEERHQNDCSAVSQIAVARASQVPTNTLARHPEWRRTTGFLWLVSAALFVFAIAVTFAWAHTRAQYLAVTRDSRPILGRLVQSSDLHLQAKGSADGILLSWNRNAADVRSAKQGILHIQDGSEERTIYLDPSDVANSSIVYRPDSSGASFRLEILGAHGSISSNSVRTPEGSNSVGSPDKQDGTALAPAAAPTNPDDLPNYIPARALKKVWPDRNFFPSWGVREETRVDVQVQIDQYGRVTAAHVRDEMQYSGGLRNATLQAAKQWVFDPAKSDGKNIPSDHTIEFQFHP